MVPTIRDITSDELHLFGNIVGSLQSPGSDTDLRALVLKDIVRLLRADFGASFLWNDKVRRFEKCVRFNVDPTNLKRYDEWFQFRDPITAPLRTRRRATHVEEVISREELVKTEFYNDFLARDGLHHGVNMYVFEANHDLGDFRIWRAKDRPDFTSREIDLLDSLEPFLRRALQRGAQRFEGLTPRECDVAALVARGCTDRDIARVLGIGFGTVRTHINRAMEKRSCANRAELAALVGSERLHS
jgi:DNA-binding CsgD family transcriptional regulator